MGFECWLRDSNALSRWFVSAIERQCEFNSSRGRTLCDSNYVAEGMLVGAGTW